MNKSLEEENEIPANDFDWNVSISTHLKTNSLRNDMVEFVINQLVSLFEYCIFLVVKGVESHEEFYKRKFDWIPEDIRNDIGHFNMFDMKRFKDPNVTIPYRRRDFYKIILVKGNSRVHYADQAVEVTHFNNFFKKQLELSPLNFRNS